MNLYILEIIGKFIRILFLTLISILNINFYSEQTSNIENTIINKENYAINRIVLPEIKKEKVENKKQNSIQTQQISNTDDKSLEITEKQLVKSEKKQKKEENQIVTEEKPNMLDQFTGKLTGYGPDCVGCSGKGNLACKTREKATYNLYKDGIYYTDKEYGKLRILSAATSKFKCGTVISIDNGNQTFMGIVLDTGGDMIRAWKNEKVWMDLAYESASKVSSDGLTGTNVNFSVLRYGW